MRRNDPPPRRGVSGQIVFGVYVPGKPEFWASANEAFCAAGAASASTGKPVKIRAYMADGKRWDIVGDEYIVEVRRKGATRRNQATARGEAALGAGLGSLAGVLFGWALGSPALRWLGSIAGGALGGARGMSLLERPTAMKRSSRRTRKRGAVGGGIGGVLGPLPAAAGAYIGVSTGNDSKKNSDDARLRRLKK